LRWGKSADPPDLDRDHNLTTCASLFLRKSIDLHVLQVEESSVQADFSKLGYFVVEDGENLLQLPGNFIPFVEMKNTTQG